MCSACCASAWLLQARFTTFSRTRTLVPVFSYYVIRQVHICSSTSFFGSLFGRKWIDLVELSWSKMEPPRGILFPRRNVTVVYYGSRSWNVDRKCSRHLSYCVKASFVIFLPSLVSLRVPSVLGPENSRHQHGAHLLWRPR